MSDDDWDDWENAEIIIPTINVLNQGQIKRIEERKLIEEADTELARDLFGTDQFDKQKVEIQTQIKLDNKLEEKIKKTKYVNKQLENELKQKDISKKIIETKLKKQRVIELYGESEEIYEYDEYDILYHS